MDDASRLSFLAKPTVATVKGAITEASVATWQNESQTLVNPPTGNGATFNVTKPPATQLNPNAPVYTATPTINPSGPTVQPPCSFMLTLTRRFCCDLLTGTCT